MQNLTAFLGVLLYLAALAVKGTGMESSLVSRDLSAVSLIKRDLNSSFVQNEAPPTADFFHSSIERKRRREERKRLKEERRHERRKNRRGERWQEKQQLREGRRERLVKNRLLQHSPLDTTANQGLSPSLHESHQLHQLDVNNKGGSIEGKDYQEQNHFNRRTRPRYPPQTGETNVHLSMAWLAQNLSSLWDVVRRIEQELALPKHAVTHRRTQHSHLGRNRHPPVTQEDPECDPSANESTCVDENGDPCGGHGRCLCGHCACEAPYYGAFCQCNDHTCPLYDGVPCGGPSHGQCRCGSCVCRKGFSGNSCNCPTSMTPCISSQNGKICSDKGSCICGRCHCQEGHKGEHCEDPVYAAGVCERLKPCVLCSAFGKDLPQCHDCQISVVMVDEMESTLTTCVMVSTGCILKYSYERRNDTYEVRVPKTLTCPKE